MKTDANEYLAPKSNVVSAQMSGTLTDEGIDFIKAIVSVFPDSCPNCGFSHKSKTFERKTDGFRCDSCNYQLQEKDFYPSIIS